MGNSGSTLDMTWSPDAVRDSRPCFTEGFDAKYCAGRRERGDLAVQPDFGVGLPEVLPDAHLFMVLAQELPADDIPIFRDDADQAVHIFGMFPNQLGQFLQLPFQFS